MKIQYNSPVVLTFALISLCVWGISFVLEGFNTNYFCLHPDFDFSSPLSYFRLVSHAAGHADWNHLIGNFSIILLIGPILEERYGSKLLTVMILVTALVTGILNTMFFDTGLMGASGIVFMMILLGSLVNMQKGTLPLTFVLIVCLYIGQEIYTGLAKPEDGVSQFGHLLGGLCGSVFGFFLNKK